MDKLEIKLTLSADSTPELLRYLRGISSARDRAFILKRLATAGLLALNGAAREEAVLLPSPATAHATLAAAVAPTEPADRAQASTTVPPSTPVEPVPVPTRQLNAPVVQPSQATAFEFLDLDALNAATAQFV